MNLPFDEILAPAYATCVLFMLSASIIGIFRTSVVQEWFDEVRGALAQYLPLAKKTCITLNNITIPTAGDSVQIGRVVVSRRGIFVIHTKKMKGWIVGDEGSAQWTQNMFGREHHFQNPLNQNARHIRALADFLQLPNDCFHSMVVFHGHAEFKTPPPQNVMTNGCSDYMNSKQSGLLPDAEIHDIVRAIRSTRSPGRLATFGEHLVSLEARHDNAAACPR